MDPVLFSLPEILLSDVEPDAAQSGSLPASYFPPRDLQLVREPDIHEPTDVEPPCVRHLILNLTDPFQPRAEDRPPFLNVLPGACPPSLGLQASPAGDYGSFPGLTPLFPELFTPCFPLDISPVTSAPNSNLESTFLPPSRVSRGTTAAATGKEQLEEPEGQRSRSYRKEEEQNKNTVERATPKLSPGLLPSLDEEAVAERNFKEYMTIINSLGPKDEEEKLTTENIPFLEYMFERCSRGDFVTEVDSLRSPDPKPVDLLPLEELEVMREEYRTSADAIFNPTTDGTSLVESTLKTECLDPALGPDPIDLLSYRELLLELMNVIQQRLAELSDSDSVTPGPEEAAPAASRVEEPAPPGWDPPGSRSDTSPNQDGHRTPPGNTSPGEGRTIVSPVLPSQADSPGDASTSPLDHDGCRFMDFLASLQLLPKTSPAAAGMASASAAGDAGASVETPPAAKPEEASTSLSNLGDTRSASASQKPQEGPLPGDPPASESPSTPSASGANEDPRTAAVEDPAPGFRADLPAGLPAPRPLPPMRDPRSPENINPNAHPEATPESFNADSCDPPADVVLSDPPSSGLRAGQQGETERKEVGKAAREETSNKQSSKRKKESKDKKTKDRCSQRLSSQTENPKAIQRGGPVTEGAEEKKACENGEKKSERDGVVYEKQKRRSSSGRSQTPRPKIGERERRQKPVEEMQTLKQEVKDPDVSRGTGAGSAPSTEIPGEENEFVEGAQKSSIARRTRSTTTAEREQPTPRPPGMNAKGRGNHSKMETQDDGRLEVKVREEEAGRQTLTVLSLRNRREKTSEDEASLAEPSPQSPKVQTDTRSTKDSTKDSSGEEPPVQERESSFVKSREIETSLNSALGPGSRPRSPTAESKRDHVSGIETWPQSASRGTEATHRPANPAGDRINGGEDEEARQGLVESPTKRPAHQRASETETISSSPGGASETGASGCKWSPPSTRSSVKAKDGKASKASGPRFSTCLHSKLPSKYHDFLLCKTNTHSRPPGGDERKPRRGRKR